MPSIFSLSRTRIIVYLYQLLTLCTFPICLAERAYPLGCSRELPSYYDYDSMPLPPPTIPTYSTEDFYIIRRIGSGKFSDVFEATPVASSPNLTHATRVVLKHLKPVSERKIKRELLVLQHLHSLPNLIRLYGIVLPLKYFSNHRNDTELPQMPTLVFQHAGKEAQWLCHPTTDKKEATAIVEPSPLYANDVSSSLTTSSSSHSSSSFSSLLSDYEIRYYLCHLLVALDALHARGIMHRDVKPRNVLITRHPVNSLTLIDVGLADFYFPTQRFNVRVASRHYKSPELLLGYEYYDYAMDLWSVGVMLAGLLLQKEPFFRGKDNLDQLAKVIHALGTDDLLRYIDTYKIKLSEEVQEVVHREGYPRQRMDWLESFRKMHPKEDTLPPDDAIDLLNRLVVYDHDERLTAEQAVHHRFFDPVRERVFGEVRMKYPLWKGM